MNFPFLCHLEPVFFPKLGQRRPHADVDLL